MATTGTHAKASSVEAILEALGQHPQATTTGLAQAAGVGRSTTGKTLAILEGQGRVARSRGTPGGGKPTPDRWALVSDPLAGQAGRAEPEPPPPEEASGGETATASTTPAETDPDQPAGQATGGRLRLRTGALRSLVHDWLAARPGQEFTPTRIGKELGRSAGAVGNALATMTDQGEVVQTSHKPRRYTIAKGRGHADATRRPAAVQHSSAAGGAPTPPAGAHQEAEVPDAPPAYRRQAAARRTDRRGARHRRP